MEESSVASLTGQAPPEAATLPPGPAGHDGQPSASAAAPARTMLSYRRRLVRTGRWSAIASRAVRSALDVAALSVAAAVVGLSAPAAVAFVVLTAVAVAPIGPRLSRRVGEDLPRLAGHVALVVVVLALAASLAAPERWLLLAPLALAGLSLSRLGHGLLDGRLAARRGGEPAIIIGAGAAGEVVARTLLERPELGLRPVGFLDTVGVAESERLPAPVLGAPEDLRRVAAGTKARHVIVAFGRVDDAAVARALRESRETSMTVYVVPRLFELGVSGADDLWGLPLVRLRRPAAQAPSWRCKRVLDIGIAATGLVLAAPLFAVVALAVRVSSPGPALYRQERIGQHGRSFELLKFRSMTVNEDGATTWSVADDDRRTPVGRLLRKTHLDELPQLLNVLRGDMSVVGPRPERPAFVARFSEEVPGYAHRHRVPVGLTGWAQVHGLVGDTSLEERVRFDNYYIEHWSLWRDLAILLRTPKTMASSGEE